jgi:uncharacterized repeat protein (TIGR01451 family)
MDDISGRGTKHTTQDEALSSDLKEEHEDHETAHKDADETKKKKGRPHTLWQRWRAGTIHNQLTVIFTVLIFLATSAYAIFSGYQLSVMKQQVAEMKSGSTDTHALAVAADTQSKQAIEQTDKMGKSLKKTDDLIRATSDLARESKRSADDADKSLSLARGAMQLEERPWVGAIDLKNLKIKVGEQVTYSLVFSNSGKTPALHLRAKVRASIYPKGIDFVPTYNPIPETTVSDTQLQPGGQFVSISSLNNPAFALTQAQYDGLTSGAATLYIYEKVTYKDVFGKSHETNVCFFVLRDLSDAHSCNKFNDVN